MSYDFPGGEARADKARLYLTLARFSGLPSPQGRREFLREEASLWVERGNFERAAYRFVRMAENTRHSEGWAYYWADRYWSMFAFNQANMWDAVEWSVFSLIEEGHSESRVRDIRHAYAQLARESGKFEIALEQIHLAYDEERDLADRVTRERELGSIYLARYEALGDNADLRLAMTAYETALARLTDGCSRWPNAGANFQWFF